MPELTFATSLLWSQVKDGLGQRHFGGGGDRKITEGKQRQMVCLLMASLTGSYWRPLEVIMVAAKSRISAPTSANGENKQVIFLFESDVMVVFFVG